MENNVFGKKVYELRTYKGLTQLDLAKHLGISPSMVSGWEIGRLEPNLNLLLKIANFFDVSIDYLLGRSFDICMYSNYLVTVKNEYSYIDEYGDHRTEVENCTLDYDGGKLAEFIGKYLCDNCFSSLSIISPTRFLISTFNPMDGTGSDIMLDIAEIKCL